MPKIRDPHGNIFDPESETFVQELMLANPSMREETAKQIQFVGLMSSSEADDAEMLSLCPHGGTPDDLRHVAEHINTAANILRGLQVAYPAANPSLGLLEGQLELLWCAVRGFPEQMLGDHKDDPEPEEDIIDIANARD